MAAAAVAVAAGVARIVAIGIRIAKAFTPVGRAGVHAGLKAHVPDALFIGVPAVAVPAVAAASYAAAFSPPEDKDNPGYVPPNPTLEDLHRAFLQVDWENYYYQNGLSGWSDAEVAIAYKREFEAFRKRVMTKPEPLAAVPTNPRSYTGSESASPVSNSNPLGLSVDTGPGQSFSPVYPMSGNGSGGPNKRPLGEQPNGAGALTKAEKRAIKAMFHAEILPEFRKGVSDAARAVGASNRAAGLGGKGVRAGRVFDKSVIAAERAATRGGGGGGPGGGGIMLGNMVATRHRTKAFRVSGGDETLTIEGEDYVQDLISANVTTFQNLLNFLVNPGNRALFPRLYRYASGWAEFWFEFLEIIYTPQVATTQAGRVILNYDTNPDETAPQYLQEALDRGGVETEAALTDRLACKLDKRWRSTAFGAPASGLDLHEYSPARVFVDAVGVGAAVTLGGLVWRFRCHFRRPRLDISGNDYQDTVAFVANGGVTQALPFGTTPTATGGAPISLSATGLLTFNAPGRWRAAFTATGATTTVGGQSVAQSYTPLVNCTVSEADAVLSLTDGATVTKVSLGAIFVVTDVPATAQIVGTNLASAWGATTTRLVITGYSVVA